eukprot:SAG31_NODE_319_length_17776_cov_4.703570_8_plen_71_part_00
MQIRLRDNSTTIVRSKCVGPVHMGGDLAFETELHVMMHVMHVTSRARDYFTKESGLGKICFLKKWWGLQF